MTMDKGSRGRKGKSDVAMNQAMRKPPGAGKGKAMGSPLESLK